MIITISTAHNNKVCIVQLGSRVVKDMERAAFVRRITELRMNKGVSAREMSLSLGQSPGYINNIENGVNLPSMSVFFSICEYLEISPAQFFDTDASDPSMLTELVNAAKSLNREQLEHLTALAKGLK